MCDDNKILGSHYNFTHDFPEGKTFPEFLLERVAQFVKNGRTEWVTNSTTGETYNFADIEPFSRNIAIALYKSGMRKGDCVVYTSHNPARFHIFCLGVWRANGYLRASYTEDTIETLVSRVEESQARFILCDPSGAADALEAARKITWQVEVIASYGHTNGCVSLDTYFQHDGSRAECPKLEITGNDVAILLATSGTTGGSKGTVHTHQTGLRTITAYRYIPWSDDPMKPTLIGGKTTHITSVYCPLSCLSTGRRVLMMQDITVENFCKTITTYKVQGMLIFPKFLLGIANVQNSEYDFSSLKYLLSGGVPISSALVETMKNRLPSVQYFFIVYGMTENQLFATNTDLSGTEHRLLEGLPPFSVGKLIPEVSLKVLHIETKEVLGVGEKGELCFRSPLTAHGYFNKPKETENTFINGWLHTGDIGYYDKDGFLFVVGRCKEVFKCDNNHVSPSELEVVIQKHPAVSDACVIGISADQEGTNTIPRAFITLKDPTASAEEIRKFADDRLASYQKLHGGLFVLPELPVGKSGKVDRNILSHIQIPIENY